MTAGGPDLGHVPLAPGRAPMGNRVPDVDPVRMKSERAADAAVLLSIICIIAWIYLRTRFFF